MAYISGSTWSFQVFNPSSLAALSWSWQLAWKGLGQEIQCVNHITTFLFPSKYYRQNVSKSWATQKEKQGKCSTDSQSDNKMKLHLENLCKFVTTNTIQAANSELWDDCVLHYWRRDVHDRHVQRFIVYIFKAGLCHSFRWHNFLQGPSSL
jgi:hypothetical protein